MPLMLLAEIQQPPAPAWVGAVLLLSFLGALVFWGVALARSRAKAPLLPREPRRRVPWHGSDLLVVLLAYVALSVVAMAVVEWSLGPELVEPLPEEEAVRPHAILEAMATGGTPILVLCIVAAVVVAPVAEEFLFRVLLQGWLESVVQRWWPLLPPLRRVLPGASGPILVSATLFAAMHIRVAGPGRRAEYLVAQLLATAVIASLLVGFAVVWLRLRTGATAADFGVAPGKLAADVRLGLWSLAALLGPLYAINIAVYHALPKHIAPDPIPLLFLAVGLGVLYARTHRIVPCIVLHAALNAVSLSIAWATL